MYSAKPSNNFHHRQMTYDATLPNRKSHYNRQRSMSTYSQSSVASSLSIKLGSELPKTPPLSALAIWPGHRHASGSFTTTSSASASLQSLADSLNCNWTPLSRHSKRTTSRRRPHGLSLTFDALSSRNGEPNHTPSSPLSIKSPASSISIPSISRTSSSFYASDAISEQNSASERKPKPTQTIARTPIIKEKQLVFHQINDNEAPQAIAIASATAKTQMDPILARLERKSKFCAQTAKCATCNKSGRDYPRCGKCSAMWCSRECRLQGRKKHACVT